ncbi:hypothetical protein BGZ76_005977, partial [Entomortierella beljakovae]
YMDTSLTKVQLNLRFSTDILLSKYGNRDWKQVKACLSDIFDIPLLQAEIRLQLHDMKPHPGEVVGLYADRIQALYSMLNNEPNPGMIMNIINCLSDSGKQMAKSRIMTVGDFESMQDLITFIRSNPLVLQGSKSPISEYFAGRFYLTKKHSQTKDTSDSGTGQTKKRSQNGSFKSQGTRTFNKDKARTAPYKKPSDNPCTHYLCRKYNRTHSDDKCYRHNDMTKFEALNQGAENKQNGSDRIQKHKKQHRVAAIRQVQNLQAEDSLGNTIADQNYNKDVKVHSYSKDPAVDRIIIPIKIQGIALRALVDPGSTISVLGEHVLKMLNGKVTNEEAIVHYMDNIVAPISRTKEEIYLSCNGYRLRLKTFVLPLENHDFIIGANLFPLFGMTINGRKKSRKRRKFHKPKKVLLLNYASRFPLRSLVPDQYSTLNEQPLKAYRSLQLAAIAKSFKEKPESIGFRGSDSNRVAVPIVINDNEYTALLDTGSTLSFIHSELADTLQITSKSENKSIAFADGSLANSLITDDKLELKCNKRKVNCHTGVLDL